MKGRLYSSDSHGFFIDTKKRKAMKKEEKAETHDDLVKRQHETEKQIKSIQQELEKRKKTGKENITNG